MQKDMTDTQQSEYSVSVVMPSYHTGPVIIRAIKSVLSQKYLKELIIVDNGNSDYVRGKIEEYSLKHDAIHIISGQGNIGFARACNLGAHEAKGNYLLFLNPDCILPTNSFQKIINEIEKDDDVWLAGCKLVNPNGSEQKGNRRNLLTFKSLAAEWFGLHRFLNIPRFELGKTHISNKNNYVPAISSALMMISRDKFNQIGTMDKSYFVHIEDLDLCFKVNQMGGKIAFLYELEVVRYGTSDDITKLNLNKHRAKGLAYYFRKNFNGAYFPGAILLIWIIIYLRFFFQASFYLLKKIKNKFCNPFLTKDEIKCYKSFVESYKEFEKECKDIPKDSKYNISNRSPVLITDTESETGISILRRLLAANIDVVALYKNNYIDIYHPKLVWIKSDINNKNLDLPKNTTVKTVFYTSNFDYIAPFLEKFAAIGTKRIIICCPLNASNKKDIIEKDISRICSKKEIDYTILKTPIVYGLGANIYFSPIHEFIKKFGRFPVKRSNFKIYSPIHADDLAISAIKILNFKETYGKSYNLIGSDKELSYKKMIEKIFKSLNKKQKISNSRFWLLFYKLYTKFTNSKDINTDIRKYKEERFIINSDEAKKDFDFYAGSFLEASNKDLGIDKT
ncbi:MAG: glycosyltransferase [Rickettsiales bacterium]|nr:glycosyltransferase [Pseudomonadota bacterium]MDG4546130.1 glycosyltransferase [Rickettsiales bacterium]MDG4547603.1 glycosyltransferase [Rickettsiales bacterium]